MIFPTWGLVVLAGGCASVSLAAEFEPNLFFNWTFFAPDTGAIAHDPSIDTSDLILDGGISTNHSSSTWIQRCNSKGIPPLGNMAMESTCWPNRSYFESVQPSSGSSDALPRLQVSLVGTDLWVQGTYSGDAASKQFTANETSASSPEVHWDGPAQPVAVRGLDYGYHQIYLEPPGGLQWNAANVTVTLGIKSSTSSLDQMSIHTEKLSDSLIAYNQDPNGNSTSKFAGEWQGSPSGLVGGSPNSSIQLKVPAKTSFLLLNGVSSQAAQGATIKYTPDLPIGGKLDFTALSTFAVDSLLHYAVLDPDIQYTVNITSKEDNDKGGYMQRQTRLRNLVFYTIPPPETSPDANTTADGAASSREKKAVISGGAIAGAVVGSVVAVALLAGFIVWLWWRRRFTHARPRNIRGEDDEFTVDDFDDDKEMPEPTVAPYPTGAETRATVQEGGDTEGLVASKLRRGESARENKGVKGQARSSTFAGTHRNNDRDYFEHKIPPVPTLLREGSRTQEQRQQGESWSDDDADFVQEQDAGTVQRAHRMRARERELIPPSYDPAWKDEESSSEDERGE